MPRINAPLGLQNYGIAITGIKDNNETVRLYLKVISNTPNQAANEGVWDDPSNGKDLAPMPVISQTIEVYATDDLPEGTYNLYMYTDVNTVPESCFNEAFTKNKQGTFLQTFSKHGLICSISKGRMSNQDLFFRAVPISGP